jgi:cytochrome c biogenesis protein CcmG/thiol:disulfide interchange protein DsbE
MSEDIQPSRRRRLGFAFLPVAIFIGLALLFAKGLITADPSKVPSALIGKPVPSFTLPPLPKADRPGLATADLNSGKVTLVNIWASWCVPCRQEHPFLMQLAKDPSIELVGINYKDKPANALEFLKSLGNPYARIGVDDKGSAAIDWGVYGVPETFIIDGKGVIRHKKIGPISASDLEKEILPQITAAKDPPG